MEECKKHYRKTRYRRGYVKKKRVYNVQNLTRRKTSKQEELEKEFQASKADSTGKKNTEKERDAYAEPGCNHLQEKFNQDVAETPSNDEATGEKDETQSPARDANAEPGCSHWPEKSTKNEAETPSNDEVTGEKDETRSPAR
ncbi:uncharacterized protein LOC124171291 [Ischnura elegans]|nr:uncharacterized protein LOC124171291 [Ischnura elegans]